MNNLFTKQRERFEKAISDALDLSVSWDDDDAAIQMLQNFLFSCQQEWVKAVGEEINKMKKDYIWDNEDEAYNRALSDIQTFIREEK